MYLCSLLAAFAAVGLVEAQETVLGVYVFSRHGDRTAKNTPPSNLTDLGYHEIFTSGTWFRNQYVADDAPRHIHGINADLVKQSQITASAPVDTVLQNSALGFLQGLYPPVGQGLGSNTLRNGTVVQRPLNGYQLIPLETVETGAGSENAAWLQGATNCAKAQISSNNYYTSSDYLTTLERTRDLYASVIPMVNGTFTPEKTTYKNAYTIWDLLNVASIHNGSSDFPSSDLLTPELFFQLRTLADQHEFNLAYNESEPIRAITGSIIANEVVEALNETITGKGKSKFNIQFGAYAGMFSFFGLADLTSVNSDFYGLPDYASTLTWELVTNASVANSNGFPSVDEIGVRFLFHNGTTSASSSPVEYPLFGRSPSPLPWTDFVAGMDKFRIKSQADWCHACGNSTGVCSRAMLSDSADAGLATSASTDNCNNGGISKAVAGTIGALVTLAVIMLVEAVIVLLGGFRLVSKKRLASQSGVGGTGKA